MFQDNAFEILAALWYHTPSEAHLERIINYLFLNWFWEQSAYYLLFVFMVRLLSYGKDKKGLSVLSMDLTVEQCGL